MAESKPSVSMAKPQESNLETEVGYSTYLPFTAPYEASWQVFRSEEPTVKQLVTMRRRDGQARALYRLVTLPIRAALRTATFVPVDGGEEEAEFISDLFLLPPNAGGMLRSFQDFMKHVLMAVFDGFSAFELVYWSPTTGPLKGKTTLKKIAYRPSDTITFLVSKDGDFDGFRQVTTFRNELVDVKIDSDVALYFAVQEEERPFYGVSLFQSAFYHYDWKDKIYHIAHIAAQRAAVGTRIGTIPPGASSKEIAAFKKGLAESGMVQWMTKLEGWDVDSLKEVGNFPYMEYINHHNSQMSKSVLAPFFDSQQGGDKSFIVDSGEQNADLFLLMLEAIMDDIASMINNDLIPRFIDWNFGSGKYPKFQWGQLTKEQRTALLDVFQSISSGQTNVSPEFSHEVEKQVAEFLGLEVDYDVVEAEAKERAQLGEFSPDKSVSDVEIPANVLPEEFKASADLSVEEILSLAGVRYVRSSKGSSHFGEPVGSPILPNVKRKVKQALTNENAPGYELLDHGDGTVSIKLPDGSITKPKKFDVQKFLRLGWKISTPLSKTYQRAGVTTVLTNLLTDEEIYDENSKNSIEK